MSEDYLDEVINRWEILEALTGESCTLRELDESLSTSRSTIHRACQNLQDLGVVEKADNEYALTSLGTIVTTETEAYRTRLLTASRLERLLNVLDPTDVDIPLEYFGCAEVVTPQPRQAHNGLKRIINLIEETDSLRMFSSIISPIYVDVASENMEQGTTIDVIFDQYVLDVIFQEYTEEAQSAMEAGHMNVFVGENIPFELFLADGKMGMAAHDHTARPQVFVETDDHGAIAWANDLYEQYKRESFQVTLDQLHSLPGMSVE